MRPRLLAALTLAILLSACGDAITEPAAVAGHYALVAVDGRPLPVFSSQGGSLTVRAGELVLRADGSCALGLLGYSEGIFQVEGRSLTVRLHAAGGSPPVYGLIEDGRVTFESALHRFDFQRTAASPPALPDATFGLATVDGRGTPLGWSDTLMTGSIIHHRVDYDSLALQDGVFFHRRRRVRTVSYWAPADSSTTTHEGIVSGSYRVVRDTAYLTLFNLLAVPPTPGIDSLALEGGQLVRRTVHSRGTREERYTRH